MVLKPPANPLPFVVAASERKQIRSVFLQPAKKAEHIGDRITVALGRPSAPFGDDQLLCICDGVHLPSLSLTNKSVGQCCFKILLNEALKAPAVLAMCIKSYRSSW